MDRAPLLEPPTLVVVGCASVQEEGVRPARSRRVSDANVPKVSAAAAAAAAVDSGGHGGGTASPVMVGTTLMISVVGPGLLCIPYTFRSAGLIMALVLLVTTACCAALTAEMLLLAHVITGCNSYDSIAAQLFGERSHAQRMVPLVNLLAIFGACTGYMQLVLTLLPTLGWLTLPVPALGATAQHASVVLTALLFACVVMPMCFLRNIASLRHASVAGFVCSLVLVFAIVRECVQAGGGVWFKTFYREGVFWGNGISTAASLVNFAFVLHLNVIPAFQSLRDCGGSVSVRGSPATSSPAHADGTAAASAASANGDSTFAPPGYGGVVGVPAVASAAQLQHAGRGLAAGLLGVGPAAGTTLGVPATPQPQRRAPLGKQQPGAAGLRGGRSAAAQSSAAGHARTLAALNAPRVRVMRRVIRAVAGCCCVVYCGMGAVAYCMFGNNVRDNILLNLPDNALMGVARTSLVLVAITAFPLMFFPLRATFHQLLWSTFKAVRAACCGGGPRHRCGNWVRDSSAVRKAEVVGLMLACFATAAAVPGIGVVFSLTGGTAVVGIIFVFPAAFFLRLEPAAHGRDAWWRHAAHAMIVMSVAIGLWHTAILVFDPAALQAGVPAAGVVPS